jgi:hypothetical protein
MDRKVKIQLAPGDRDRLEALIANGNTPQKHAGRQQADHSALADSLCRGRR